VSGQEAVAAPADVTGFGDSSQESLGGIFDGWKRLGPRAVAGAEASERWIVGEGFVRAERVVDLPAPVVEVGAEVFEIVASGAWPEFAFEGAVEAFGFALSLGVVGAAMEGSHTEPDESGLEPGERFGHAIRGAEGVVAEESVGEAELAEGFQRTSKAVFMLRSRQGSSAKRNRE
jgi:hypothetical protein